MSFRCEMCDEYQGRGSVPTLITVETADCRYSPRRYKGRHGRIVRDPGGVGYEIVKQLAVCHPCQAKFVWDLSEVVESVEYTATDESVDEIVSGLKQIIACNSR